MSYTSYSARVGPRTDVWVSIDRGSPSAAGTIRLLDPDTHATIELTAPVDVLREVACLLRRSDPHLPDHVMATPDRVLHDATVTGEPA